MRKTLGIILVMAFVLGLSSPVLAAGNVNLQPIEQIDNGLEPIEVLLVASAFLNASNMDEDILISDSTVDVMLPLYNLSGDVVAYYVTFSPNGYAVVNNNKNNPTTIEFGESRSPYIEDILLSDSEPHVIYNTPTEVYNLADTAVNSTSESNYDLYDYYPELEADNLGATIRLAQMKHLVNADVALTGGDGNYGFYDWDEMPSGDCEFDVIREWSSTDWITMGEVSDIGEDHCAATAVTNLALYFANCGYTNLKINTNRETFAEIYSIVDKGPVMTIASQTVAYFRDRGYTLYYSMVSNFSGYKTAFANNRPCALLLKDALLAWHWVIGIGYREYTTGEQYIRIIDGWNDNHMRFYRVDYEAELMLGQEFWIPQSN